MGGNIPPTKIFQTHAECIEICLCSIEAQQHTQNDIMRFRYCVLIKNHSSSVLSRFCHRFGTKQYSNRLQRQQSRLTSLSLTAVGRCCASLLCDYHLSTIKNCANKVNVYKILVLLDLHIRAKKRIWEFSHQTSPNANTTQPMGP